MNDCVIHSHPETADEALARIVEGFQHFKNEIFPSKKGLFESLAYVQNPRAMFITCADSRVIPELITNSSPGDLFVTRNVGNVVPSYEMMNGGVSTAIEYAVLALNVHHIIICGHSDCGAMRAVLDPKSLRRMPTVQAWLRHAEVARTVVEDNYPDATGKERLAVLTEENVVSQLDHLRTHPSVASRLPSGQLFIHGWVYDIESGAIKGYDAEQRAFLTIEADGPIPVAMPRPRFT